MRQQLTKSGEPLASVGHISVAPTLQTPDKAQWILLGVTSNERYVERKEKDQLVATQQGLGRTDSTYAALIPIRKNPQWWAMFKMSAAPFLRNSRVTLPPV